MSCFSRHTADLGAIRVPVLVVQAEGDEFIRREHAEYLVQTLPNATLRVLPGVTHFAPIQNPDLFNDALLNWLLSVSHQGHQLPW